ncbi:MAG: hypothetical protein H6R18_564 [Proteobacteria bacterium]|nr:hypothetical protein [Pseudomonadota bacterium]
MAATRTEQKSASLQRILDAGAVRLRTEGLSGAGIALVMRDAGLTHGAFNVHFANKNELAVAALRHALLENRKRWVGTLKKESWMQRLQRLAQRYLTKAHRDNLADSCALAALATEAARSDSSFRKAYEEEILKSLHGICGGHDAQEAPKPEQLDEAIAFMALCLGGLSMARAVTEEKLSERILSACSTAASRLASTESLSNQQQGG